MKNSPAYAAFQLLMLVIRISQFIILKAAERKEAGNLEALQAAIDMGTKARTKEEAINASKAFKDALQKRK